MSAQSLWIVITNEAVNQEHDDKKGDRLYYATVLRSMDAPVVCSIHRLLFESILAPVSAFFLAIPSMRSGVLPDTVSHPSSIEFRFPSLL